MPKDKQQISGFAPIVGRQARTLILGSMPSEASLAAREYYGLPRNAFWPIMGELFGAGHQLPYENRIAVLKRQGIAIWDVLAECQRQGSLDSAINMRSVKINDFSGFFRRHRGIRRVFFNGSKAAEIFRRRVLPDVALLAPYLRYERLPSTSPAMASLSFSEKLTAWTIISNQTDT